jgi:RNA polymerase sigma-70 factor (ECF subfamily)
MKNRERVMDNVASHEDWKVCFTSVAPGLLLFARQWVRSRAGAEDIIQEAFVKFWRRNHKIDNPENIVARELFPSRALLYATVRSVALDLIRRDSHRARREAQAFSESEQIFKPQFESVDETQRILAAAVDGLPCEQRCFCSAAQSKQMKISIKFRPMCVGVTKNCSRTVCQPSFLRGRR